MGNLSSEVSLEWAGSERLFALKAKQIEGLEHDCGEGIGRICMRVFARTEYSFKHLRQTIYWGLIGGGMPATEASKLVLLHVDGAPIDPVNDPSSTLKTASSILKAVHFGWEALPASGEAGAGETRQSEPTSASTGPHSSAPE